MSPLLLLILAPCCASQSPPGEQTTLVRGTRQKSGSVKASREQPHGYGREEKSPFQADPFDIEAYAEHLQRRHQEGHGKQVLSMAQFSHPACSGLQGSRRTSCPVLAVVWETRHDVPEGVELVGKPVDGLDAAQLQRRVLCHMAFGRVQRIDDGCPLHLRGVRARVVQQKDGLHLMTTAGDPATAAEIRRRMKALVSTR